MQIDDAARALCALDRKAPYAFHIWLAGAWGFETEPRLRGVLHSAPQVSQKIKLDCRRVTVIDGTAMTAMTDFADACARRGVGVTFECYADPVGRLIDVCGFDRFTVTHRPLLPRTAERVWAKGANPTVL